MSTNITTKLLAFPFVQLSVKMARQTPSKSNSDFPNFSIGSKKGPYRVLGSEHLQLGTPNKFRETHGVWGENKEAGGPHRGMVGNVLCLEIAYLDDSKKAIPELVVKQNCLSTDNIINCVSQKRSRITFICVALDI